MHARPISTRVVIKLLEPSLCRVQSAYRDSDVVVTETRSANLQVARILVQSHNATSNVQSSPDSPVQKAIQNPMPGQGSGGDGVLETGTPYRRRPS